jgi:transposase
MSKRFRECSLEQPFLLAPSLQDWLPEDHLARFIAEVVETFDLSEIYAQYERKDGRGLAAYHPLMLTRLILYAYASGRASSRKIEQATHDDVAFRYLAADQHPDHDTIAQFRQQHLESLSRLFVQALRLCQRAGLVKLGQVAIDGTKIRANASTHQSVRYQQIREQEQQWERKVAQLLEEAERIDAEEDRRYGKGKKGNTLPEELASAEKRLKRLRQAQRELEQEARERAEQAQREQQEHARRRGRPSKEDPPPALDATQRAVLRKRAQRLRRLARQPERHYNFTDPESRLMLDHGLRSYVQGYNAQIAVDGHRQVIVAADLTQEVTDQHQLLPMVQQAAAMAGKKPSCVTADAGYWYTAHLTHPVLRSVELLVPPESDELRRKNVAAKTRVNAVAQAMRAKLRDPVLRGIYRLRQAIVEPVFAQIKEGRGLRRFLLRGLAKTRAEWNLICLTHNLLKLFRHKGLPTLA